MTIRQMLQQPSSRAIFLINTVLLIAGFAWLYVNASTDPIEHGLVEYQWARALLNETVPDIRVRNREGKLHRLTELTSGRWTMLVVASELPAEPLVYPEILSSRFKDYKLQYVFVLPRGVAPDPSTSHYLTTPQLLVMNDDTGSLKRTFSLSNERFAAFLLISLTCPPKTDPA